MIVTVALAIVALASICLIVRSWRHSGHVDDPHTVPQRPQERMYRWRQRLDVALGAESEEVLCMHAKGIAAKRRMLAELRNRTGKALVQVKHATKPEQIPTTVVVRKPLRLAR